MKLARFTRKLAAVCALGALGGGLSPTAGATAIYGADALVQVMLTSVQGGTLGSDVFVTYGNRLSSSEAVSSGLLSFAVADPLLFPGEPAQPMPANGSLEHDHVVLGEAGGAAGTAFSSLSSDGIISIDNRSGGDVELAFEYSILLSVYAEMIGDPAFADAFAEAIVEIFDDSYAFVDVFGSVSASLLTGTTSDDFARFDTFLVTLPAGGLADVSVLVETFGGATNIEVAEPGVLALLAPGFLLLIAGRRRGARQDPARI